MISGWPPMRGCCRCGCWRRELGCGPGSGRRCAWRGSSPLYDRGQLLADLALVLIAGGEAISDFQALAHLAPLIGPVPSAPTVWRALYRQRATDREKEPGRRYQLITTSTPAGQIAWLDALHRFHVHVENDVKQARALGLNRWPSRHWAINVAWTQIVALAANLLACFRHLALPAGELREAAPKVLRLLHVPGRLTRGQRKRWLHLRADWPWTTDLINAWHAVSALPPL